MVGTSTASHHKFRKAWCAKPDLNETLASFYYSYYHTLKRIRALYANRCRYFKVTSLNSLQVNTCFQVMQKMLPVSSKVFFYEFPQAKNQKMDAKNVSHEENFNCSKGMLVTESSDESQKSYNYDFSFDYS